MLDLQGPITQNLPASPRYLQDDPHKATENDPITYDMAIKLGLWITHKAAHGFYLDNQKRYRAAGFDEEDIVAHLRWYILTQRYLVTVEKNQTYYKDQASYRASLWVACRKACFAHHRKHIAALKRGLALVDGASQSLDKVEDDGYKFQLQDRGARGRAMSEQIHKTTGHDYLDVALAWFRSGGTWDELKKSLASIWGFSEIENLGRAIRSHLIYSTPT